MGGTSATTSTTPGTPTGDAFFTSLNPGALGISPGFEAAVELAGEFGFGAVDPDARYLGEQPEAELSKVGERLESAGLRWGSGGVPVDLTGEAAKFAEQLSGLPAYAATLAAAGVERAGTWIRPMSDAVTYQRNFARHVERVGLVDEILSGAGIRFGLEYVGPKTFWSTELYPFVHTLAEARELLAAVGSSNVGVILDTFHWYTAGETADDLRGLTADQVVAVDLNDAPVGRERDEQIDGQRTLPGATGVIDLAGFVGALRDIGYAGPIKVEPFNAELRALPVRDVVAKTADSLSAVL
ncbi:TIM barrel protein [Actinopolymorpha sp. B11F2]|uniref:sugar phosphate isomerase/epimerase family protein n=1 Tax=Actinopolymorpha sp. B11F2 TaxID=3160862 RepID=UPI0032E48F89